MHSTTGLPEVWQVQAAVCRQGMPAPEAASPAAHAQRGAALPIEALGQAWTTKVVLGR